MMHSDSINILTLNGSLLVWTRTKAPSRWCGACRIGKGAETADWPGEARGERSSSGS